MKISYVTLALSVISLPLAYGMDYDKQLLEAAEAGNTELVKDLIVNHGVNINTQDNEGWASLHWAAYNGHTETVNVLLKFSANIHVQNHFGKTPLRFAAYKGHTATTECLLSYGAVTTEVLAKHATTIKAQKRQAKLNHAANNNNLKSVAILLSKGAYCNSLVKAFINTKRQDLFQAIAQDNIEQVKVLLKQTFSLNTCDKEGNTLLHKAIESGSVNTTKLLITLLHNAGTIDTYLLKTNNAGITPLELAVNNQNMLKLLLGLRQEPQD